VLFLKAFVMATVTKFEELEVWQLAREPAIEIFELFSNSEQLSSSHKGNKFKNRKS
jgi:hypothetical protein